jgi:hypothetical protein
MFVEQIINGLLFNNWCIDKEWSSIMLDERNPNKNMVISSNKVKIHTLREDAKNRWVKGVLIDFYIGVRTKNAFRFAPRVPVLHVQEIVIKNIFNDRYSVIIDGNPLSPKNIEELAMNDGFDSVDDFWNWFGADDFVGKIIHWTCKKY